jgi:endo-1,4-beta-D-glucanase Y
MRFNTYLIVLFLPAALLAAPKFPFPQNAKYPYGIKPAAINSDNIQKAYNDFIARFYEENADKSKARIKWDTPSITVSEGIGYGMLIFVYMDNATNNTQEKFDKLWKYYNSYLDRNRLMNWKINGFDNVAGDGQGAATDAEMDVAMALVQAYKQWGDQKYLDNAKVFIDSIWKHEVNSNGYLKPGDSWDGKKNPSYFATAALESFKHAGTQDWQKVITSSYSLLKKAQNQTTGLVPDWCQENGTPIEDKYYYDATRTPWRIAWGYVWYGHNDAKEFCSKIASWIAKSTNGKPIDINDGYNLNGNVFQTNYVSAFVGSFACAGMVDATHQTWLNEAYKAQDALTSEKESYFCTTLKLTYLLLLSGNMPDFWNPQTSTIPDSKTQKINYLSSPVISFDHSTVSISVSEPDHVTLDLYSIDGKLVSNLINSYIENGDHRAIINRSINNGMYVLKLRTASQSCTRTFILNR